MLASTFDFLIHLPDHRELSALFADHGMAFTEHHAGGFNGALHADTLIHRAPLFTRDRIVAAIKRMCMLSDEESLRYMLDACAGDIARQDALRAIAAPALRALWLYRRHPESFQVAVEARWADETLETYTQQRDLPARLRADGSSQALIALAGELSLFFMTHDRCGQICKTVFCDDAGDGNVEVMVYLEDRRQARLEVVDGEVRLREATPVRRLAIRYASATGQLLTMIDGAAEYHDALMDAFARHILHIDVDAGQHAPARLSMECFKQPLPLPADRSLESLSLRELTLLDESTGGELRIKAPAHDNHIDVHALLARWMPVDRPLHKMNFKAISATVGVRIVPEAGQPTMRSIALRLKRRGGTNLDVFESAQRRQFESWITNWCLTEPSYRHGGSSESRALT